MDDSAHGDEPGPGGPKQARSADARGDTSLREPVADAIPTIAPHPPRLPPQTPPRPEDASASDSAAAVPLEPVSAAPVLPDVQLSPPPADADSDWDGRAAPVIDAHLEAEVPPAPDSVSSGVEDLAPEPEEIPVAGPTVEELAPEAHVPPEVAAQKDETYSDAPSDTDLTEAASHPSPDRAEFLAPVDDLALDAAPSELEAAAPITAAIPADPVLPSEQPTPIGEEQIWSVPDAGDTSLHWPLPERDGALPQPPAEPGIAVHPPSPDERHAPATALVEAVQSPGPLPQVDAWAASAFIPATALPAPGQTRDILSKVGFAARVAGAVVLALVGGVLLLVVLYRWVDPPASTLMLGQRLAGTEIEQKWVPLDRISPNLVQAVILSEDGAFCRHRGVDWSALEEAIESSRGGSTITMQVVKNLFLWPGRSYVRKALEIMLAYVVEVVWSKERVLEIYLNIAEWGPGVFGAEAAARTHFGKAASRLTAQEAALLAVSLPSPIERQAGYPGWQTRRLADNLLIRMRAVRGAQRCVRGRRGGA